ncbi:MAG TPA: histidine kinase dimerization/phosphoacceptor domain -containing protein [Caulobacterales bacterium]|nr:histidine kinase dimerization/phosphoacceptor domain -containing protein [Caulobacterales bacterium]
MALLLGMAMLPAGAIAMQVGLNAVSAHRSAVEESLGRRALQSLQSEQDLIDQVRELLRVLATSPSIQQAQSGNCRRWFGDVLTEYPFVSAIVVSSTDGGVICSLPSAPRNLEAQPSRIRELARTRDDLAMGYVQEGRLTHQPILAALQPVRDARRKTVGFIGLSVSIDTLRGMLTRDRGAIDARVAIVDAAGRILAEASPQADTRQLGLPTPSQIRSHMGASPSFVPVRNGHALVVPLQSPDLYAVMSWAPEDQNWTTWVGYVLSVAAPLMIWLLAVAAGWFAIEIYVARPLSSIEAAARSYARGEELREDESLINAPIEIRSLRRTLAAMAKTLRGREARLVEALGEERALLREVHHRVKNNLQMVASLLSIQSRGAKDESEAWGLARAHDRVQLLSQVHQRIYASGEIREIRLDELAADIARQMLSARGPLAQKIRLDLDLHEARVNADRAVPMAFLIGEGLSTALDALGETQCTRLELHLAQDADGVLRFAIDADARSAQAVPPATARLIDAFARQLGAHLGRNPDRPYMIWASIPPPQHEANEHDVRPRVLITASTAPKSARETAPEAQPKSIESDAPRA